jgi:hypothetical protein
MKLSSHQGGHTEYENRGSCTNHAGDIVCSGYEEISIHIESDSNDENTRKDEMHPTVYRKTWQEQDNLLRPKYIKNQLVDLLSEVVVSGKIKETTSVIMHEESEVKEVNDATTTTKRKRKNSVQHNQSPFIKIMLRNASVHPLPSYIEWEHDQDYSNQLMKNQTIYMKPLENNHKKSNICDRLLDICISCYELLF